MSAMGTRRSIGTAEVMKLRRALTAALAGMMFVQPVAAAQGPPHEAPSLASGPVQDAVNRLKPGQYLWMPQIAPDGPVLVWVNLTTQRAIVFRNGVAIGISTISSGKPGHDTPTGVFTILQKHVEHHSNLYDNAPMPFMQRLTWAGVAMHGGQLPGYPASHGCVRLPLAFAKLLFGVTNIGLTVVVSKGEAVPRFAPTGQPLSGPMGDSGVAADGTWQWRPELSPNGPVSILVSTSEKVVRVVRNGIEIGSAPVTLSASVQTPAAYFLHRMDPEGPHWIRLPLPGQEQAEGEAISDTGERPSVPPAFRERVLAALRPGATLIITSDRLGTPAPALPVLEGRGGH